MTPPVGPRGQIPRDASSEGRVGIPPRARPSPPPGETHPNVKPSTPRPTAKPSPRSTKTRAETRAETSPGLPPCALAPGFPGETKIWEGIFLAEEKHSYSGLSFHDLLLAAHNSKKRGVSSCRCGTASAASAAPLRHQRDIRAPQRGMCLPPEITARSGTRWNRRGRLRCGDERSRPCCSRLGEAGAGPCGRLARGFPSTSRGGAAPLGAHARGAGRGTSWPAWGQLYGAMQGPMDDRF